MKYTKPKMIDFGDYLPGGHHMPQWVLQPFENFLGFTALNVAHEKCEIALENGSPRNFFNLACEHLNLLYDLSGLENIPAEGPCVIVCNHPHGMSDGLMFGDVAMKVRQDVRIVVNEFLHCVRGMRQYEITVDVYGGDAAKRANMQGMREILKWLRGGHCILVFPSGSAASWSEQDGRVIDDPWQENIAALIRKTGATVVPMHISGHTGRLFQWVTRVAKEHRAALLPREIKRDGRMRHRIALGKPVSPATIATFATDAALSDYLRLCSMLQRYEDAPAAAAAPARDMAPVDAGEQADVLQGEIDALPADALYYSSEVTGLQVYGATAAQIPHLMHELGVQRELTFRAVGEGSGTACDLDRYDQHYVHLIMWDSREHRLAGAYRIGRTDDIVRDHGVKGIYNAEFFDFAPEFVEFVSRGIEMGRAFITPPYQRQAASLDTLWMGIGSFLNRNPQYRYLYGTVSVSADFSKRSRSLILSYLRANAMLQEHVAHVTPHTPPTDLGLNSEDERLLPTALPEVKLLASLVSELEADGKSIPVLLRQYLRLGGRMVSFNIDNDFGGTLDCLVVVDLAYTPERLLKRYCGEAEATRKQAEWRAADAR